METRKVLIVDDEEDICISLKEIIERRKGCQVFAVTNAVDAWKIFQKETPYSCIIDLHMPFCEFDGVELIRKIREINKDSICLVLTRVDDRVEEIKRMGINGYYIKPLDTDELNKMIDKVTM